MRALVGVEGIAGHALPALALGRELARRGHTVHFQSDERWRETAEGFGMRFAGPERGLDPGAGIAARVRGMLPRLEELAPDVVVSDGLTLTPALAAEVAGLPAVTIFPEVYPYPAPGLPPFSVGLQPPRTRLGAMAWRALAPRAEMRLPTTGWLRAAREAMNAELSELGLPPLTGRHGPVVRGPALVATLPELEYPRRWPPGVEVIGPMGVDLPQAGELELPPGADPLVLVAPSTVKDPERRLVRTALEALAGEPVRVLASTSGAEPPADVPPNAIVSGWVDYSKAMPRAALVVSNGTHGTIVKALGLGIPLAIAPAMPDDAEHGARVAWAGAGLSTTRRAPSPRTLRSVIRRVLGDPAFAERARRIAAANAGRDGASRGADLIEGYAP